MISEGLQAYKDGLASLMTGFLEEVGTMSGLDLSQFLDNLTIRIKNLREAFPTEENDIQIIESDLRTMIEDHLEYLSDEMRIIVESHFENMDRYRIEVTNRRAAEENPIIVDNAIIANDDNAHAVINDGTNRRTTNRVDNFTRNTRNDTDVTNDIEKNDFDPLDTEYDVHDQIRYVPGSFRVDQPRTTTEVRDETPHHSGLKYQDLSMEQKTNRTGTPLSLRNADLRGVVFAEIVNATFDGADLRGADLRKVDFNKNEMRGMIIDDSTKLTDVQKKLMKTDKYRDTVDDRRTNVRENSASANPPASGLRLDSAERNASEPKK